MSEATTRLAGKHGTPADGAEHAVILHPLPVAAGAREQPKHVHHGRVVTVQKAANEIILEPTPRDKSGAVGVEDRHRYVRTEEIDESGCPIFRQGPLVV